jgi:flavin reductase (DIM6/NTAB) family NADH-FMN oxidoreductase RutF
MDNEAKKTALRMIPYGIYVLTSEASASETAAATVNWVTQVSFQPPLLVVAVKTDSGAHAIVEKTGKFALNVLGKGQKDLAFTFFKTAVREGNTISGQPFRASPAGQPMLDAAAAVLDCKVTDAVKRGDHTVFVAEVTEAIVQKQPEGRADDAVLAMRDLGDKTFYGG